MFSRPLISGWKPAPSSIRLETLPRIVMLPSSGYMIRVRSLRVVLLPQPLWPIRPTASPFRTLKLMSFSTTRSSKRRRKLNRASSFIV